MNNLDSASKERIKNWILEMKRVIRHWDEIRYDRLTPEQMQRRAKQQRQRRKFSIANRILKSL